MSIFKPEDFYTTYAETPLTREEQCFVANLANAKLEREGKVVYGKYKNDSHWEIIFSDCVATSDTHKALIINIEKIEKCKHPAEYLFLEAFVVDGIRVPRLGVYTCEKCGAKVKPTVFEEVK